MTEHGRLFVFEGPDGVGKSTLAEALCERIRSRNLLSLSAAFPGNDPESLGHLIYRLQHRPGELGVHAIDPASLQALHAAAQMDAIRRNILPALRNGVWVVLDRYWWSTRVYGRVAHVPSDILDAIVKGERLCWNGVLPDIVFLILRDSPLREDVDLAYHQRLIEMYRDVAAEGAPSTNIHVVRNDGARYDAIGQLLELVSEFLPRT